MKKNIPFIHQDFDFIAEWQKLKGGDRNSFNAIIRAFYQVLYTYGLKISGDAQLTEDCIQDLFVYIWENRAKLSDVRDGKPYLLKALRRRILEALKKWEHRKQKTEWFDEEGNSHEESFAIVFSHEDFLVKSQENNQKLQRLQDALNTLPPRQKEALYLKFYGDLSYEEIGDVLGINSQSVANLLQRALKFLRKYFLFFACVFLP